MRLVCRGFCVAWVVGAGAATTCGDGSGADDEQPARPRTDTADAATVLSMLRARNLLFQVIAMLRTSSRRLSVWARIRQCLRPWSWASAVPIVILLLAANSSARVDGPLATATNSVAQDLAAPATTLVVASSLVSDVPAPRGDELAERVAVLVASAAGSGARAAVHPASLAAARALSGRAGALVYIEVRVADGELRLTADLYPVVANAWDRVRAPLPPPTKHSYVHVPVAAEVRSYLAPLHLEQARVSKFTHDLGPVLAVACGDLQGASGNGIALATEKEVAWGHLAAGRFVGSRRVPAVSVGVRAPTPMREPMASLAIVPGDAGGTLYVGWSGRVGAALGKDLLPRSDIVGLPGLLDEGAVCFVPSSAKGAFEAVAPCTAGPALHDDVPPVPVFDAWSQALVSLPDGTATRVVAARDPVTATLHLRRGRESLTVAGVGAQLAVGDLDQDGVVEVVTTAAAGEDAIVVSSWRANEGLVERARFAAAAGVEALAVCPPEANEAPSLVAVVGREIWLVH